MIFIDKKTFFIFEIGLTLLDLNQIFLMKPSEFKNSVFIDSYDNKELPKMAEISMMTKNTSKLSKISFPNFNDTI